MYNNCAYNELPNRYMENNLRQIPSLAVNTLKSGKIHLKILEGTVTLSAWEGFQSRKGAYNSKDRQKTSDGGVKLTVGEFEISEDLLSVSTEQVTAYNFLVAQQGHIKEIILNAILPYYKQLQQQYGYEEDDESMPNVTATSHFKNLIGLSSVHLLTVCKDGSAYVGYEFGCKWDEEHGLGVLMHQQRIIEIGAADTSFDTCSAEKDSDPVKAAKVLEKYKNFKLPPPPKPWWKFWA